MECFTKHTSEVTSDPDNLPCGNGTGYQQCCNEGDQCGADGFCHFTHAQSNFVTGYYLGGCTDPSFDAAVCPQPCTQYGTQDVIYNSTSQLWECCYGSGSLDCNIPGNESFAAPPAAQLFATSSSSTAGTSSSTKTASSSTSTKLVVSTSATATSSNSSSSKSSDTTTIAVAVAVPVVVILLALGSWFWWLSRRKTRKSQPPEKKNQGKTENYSRNQSHGWEQSKKGEASRQANDRIRMSEMSAQRDIAESGGAQRSAELYGYPVVELPTGDK